MFSGFTPTSRSLTISASRIVVFPAPGTAEIAILPDLYSRTGFWSSRGIILNDVFSFFSWLMFSSIFMQLSIPPKFSIPFPSNKLEKAKICSSAQRISFLKIRAVFSFDSSILSSMVNSSFDHPRWKTHALYSGPVSLLIHSSLETSSQNWYFVFT